MPVILDWDFGEWYAFSVASFPFHELDVECLVKWFKQFLLFGKSGKL